MDRYFKRLVFASHFPHSSRSENSPSPLGESQMKIFLLTSLPLLFSGSVTIGGSTI